MANKAQAIGFRPHGQVISSNVYVAGSTVYPGDPVSLAADGAIDPSSTVPLLGVALNYALVGENVLVADNPNQQFLVEADEALTQADVGANFVIALGSPSTTYKRSAAYVDADTPSTTATLAVKVLAINPAIDNAAGSDNVDVIVKINNHILGSHTGTAGLTS